jgi:hypothetical protein
MPDENAAPFKRHRAHQRYAVSWKAVVVAKRMGKQETHHGTVCDLSLGGATILTDRNIFHSAGHVVVTIEIPACRHNTRKIIVGAKCHILHSIISSEYGKHRIGIGFIDFDGNGKGVLTEALSRMVSISDKISQSYMVSAF